MQAGVIPHLRQRQPAGPRRIFPCAAQPPLGTATSSAAHTDIPPFIGTPVPGTVPMLQIHLASSDQMVWEAFC